jgi:hypothetical protein
MIKSFSTFPCTIHCAELFSILVGGLLTLPESMGGKIPATRIRLPDHTQDLDELAVIKISLIEPSFLW